MSQLLLRHRMAWGEKKGAGAGMNKGAAWRTKKATGEPLFWSKGAIILESFAISARNF